MLRSPVPVYICSTAFSLVMFSTADRRQPLAAGPGKIMHTSLRANSSSLNKEKTISMVPPQGKSSMKYVRHYIKNNDQCLFNAKQRSEVPFTIIDSVFNHYGLPHELKYLAVIESELKASAVSPVGAKGPWQLMPATAHIFGLKTNHQTDERMNYYKSTRAAARYLKDLYHEFGDWLLVLAAYNGGPAPVIRAIHKSHNRNFWALQQWLPSESRNHVKKFIATDYYFNQTESPAKVVKTTAPVTSAISITDPVEKLAETPDQKFSRLMQESAQSLKRSKEMLVKLN
jgi:membrane-bound lytic murein transglycosylase MltF